MKTIVLFAALLSGAAALTPGVAGAQVGFTLEVGTPPPPAPIYEPVPPQRYGYEWVPGFWNWDGQTYVWVPGYWVEAREGYYFDAPTWIIIDNRWHLNRGGWHPGRRGNHGRPGRPGDHRDHDHDRDRDHDRRPDNRPNIRPDNRPDHRSNWGHGAPQRAAVPVQRQADHDRDGVPNRVDRDRDGDGRPNHFDRAPDNAHRR